MDVVKIVAGLVLVVGVFLTLVKLQGFSRRKYGVPIFNLASFGLMVVAWVLFILSFYVLPEQHTMTQLFEAIRIFSFPEPISNSIALLVLSALILVFVLAVSAYKTNPLLAAVAFVVQLIGSMLILPLLVLFLFPEAKKKKKKRRLKKQRIV